ncbi:MAG: DnaD domain protein [Dehalococcoidia bacterium]|nr:DnaD domain protein [Dehalococcoidia bacterium]MCA9845193.1 DnaD domain protein [Dehalococcoidia bacterium]MCA9852170.1 DnaD domain protein [Dehalococcoidia bacterium]
MPGDRFEGFASASTGTAIPNLFFSRIAPTLSGPDALLAFLWLAKVSQAVRGTVRAATAEDIWLDDGAAGAFEALGSGRDGLDAGLKECVEKKATLALDLAGPGGPTRYFFVNTPESRRTIARIKAGEIQLRPSTIPVEREVAPSAPAIFKLYEEHFGTLTPFVGDRLLEVAATYPEAWVEEAVREAALARAKNWRYVERVLDRWTREGRTYETPGRNTLEEQKQRFLGGRYGHIARSS